MMNGKIDEEIMDVMEANEDDIELFEDEKENDLQRSKTTKKKERSAKQIESLKKAQEARKRNIQLRKDGKLGASKPKVNQKHIKQSTNIVLEDQAPDVQEALEEHEIQEQMKYNAQVKRGKAKRKPVRRKIIIENDSSSESEEEVIVIKNKRKKGRAKKPLPSPITSSESSDEEYYAEPQVISKNEYLPQFRFI
jgi:hypothetical protein